MLPQAEKIKLTHAEKINLTNAEKNVNSTCPPKLVLQNWI